MTPEATWADPADSASTLLWANRIWPCWKWIFRTAESPVTVRIPDTFCRSRSTNTAAAGFSERLPSTAVATPGTLQAFTSASRICAGSNGLAKYATGCSSRMRSGLACL